MRGKVFVTLVCSILLFSGSIYGAALNYTGSTLWNGASDVEVDGSYAYCAFIDGVMIYDINNRANPSMTSQLYLGVTGTGIAAGSSRCYYTAAEDGLFIIANPSTPSLAGSIDLDGSAQDVVVSGNYAYVACGNAGLQIVDITTITNPTLAGSFTTNITWADDITIDGNYVYLTDTGGDLHIVDVTTPGSPTSVADFTVPHGCQTVAIDGNYAYLGTTSFSMSLIIADISTPASPAVVGSLDTGGWTRDIKASGNYAFISDAYYFRVVNVTNPASPFIAANSSAMTNLQSCFYDGANYCYLADYYVGMEIVQVTTPSSPVEIGEYRIDNNSRINDTYVVGNEAYVASHSDGLHAVDVTDKSAPVVDGNHATDEPSKRVCVASNTAFIANDDTTLITVNVTNPASMTRLGAVDTTGTAYCIYVDGNYAYTGYAGPGMMIYDVTTPASPSPVGSYTSSDAVYDIVVDGSYAYIANYGAGLRVINVSTPASPTESGYYDTYQANGVDKSGLFAYVADYTEGLKIISVNNPASPALISTYDTDGYARDVKISGNYAFVADDENGVLAIDISNQASPTLVAHYNTPGRAMRVFVLNDYVYVSDYNSMIVLSFSETGIEERFETVPGSYALSQNYPNPFNSSTEISFNLTQSGNVQVNIYDITGRKVTTAFNGYLGSGPQNINWNAAGLSSGMYFYRIAAEEYNETGKMTLLK